MKRKIEKLEKAMGLYHESVTALKDAVDEFGIIPLRTSEEAPGLDDIIVAVTGELETERLTPPQLIQVAMVLIAFGNVADIEKTSQMTTTCMEGYLAIRKHASESGDEKLVELADLFTKNLSEVLDEPPTG